LSIAKGKLEGGGGEVGVPLFGKKTKLD